MRILECFRPTQTISISVTGSQCSLKCAHCEGYFLKSMQSITDFEKQGTKHLIKSCLISGGCRIDGRVPFNEHIPALKNIKQKYGINIHTGFINCEEIDLVTEIADVVSFDIPTSDYVIREVYGLDHNVGEYIELYKKISEKIIVHPHVCLGLGREETLESELELIEKLSEFKPETLCFIVFMPIAGTKLGLGKVPNIENVARVFRVARAVLKDTKIILGCMRPRGIYRKELDVIAVNEEIDGIVMPAKQALEEAKRIGREVVWSNECCAFA